LTNSCKPVTWQCTYAGASINSTRYCDSNHQIKTRKAEDDEIKKLSAEEQQAIGLNNLIGMKTAVKDENGLKEARENLEKLLKEHNINLEELVDNYSEALNSKGPLIKEEVDRQIQAFEKKIDAWEAK